jgi:hypothetical protein
MALTDENGSGMVMPVTPMGGGNSGFGDFGGGWWILILFILLGGWNNGFGGGFGGNNDFFPWMNQSNQISSGFANQANGMAINGLQSAITSGFGDVQTALCGGFAGVNAGIANGFAQAEIAANSRQMADMNQNFAMQSALQGCCCENRAGLADLKYTIATENCADRAAVSDALANVIASNTANTQRILDKLCQQEIDALKDRNIELQNRVNMLNMTASQTAQTAQLIADNTMQTQYIVNRVAPYPIPSYTVANPVTPAA